MARTKKQQNPQIEEQPKEPVKETTSTGSSGTIKYQGKLDVSIQKGNRTISRKTYHNTGTDYLFKFLCECIVGSYNKSSRPLQIKLYAIESDDEKPDQEASWKWLRSIEATPYPITYSNAGVALDYETQTPNDYVAIFEFKVPFSYITKDVYKVALFPNTILSEQSDNDYVDINKCAYFGFTKNDGTEWDPIIKQDNTGNYSLTLTWTMKLSN